MEAVVFNGRLTTIDGAASKTVRLHLLSVEAERDVFQDLVLAKVDPAACLKRLNGLVSLAGVMADHSATTEVLVTTSWFGRAAVPAREHERTALRS